jgi:hypothetical protein
VWDCDFFRVRGNLRKERAGHPVREGADCVILAP